jgi:Cu-processing system permease protein
MNSLRLVTVLAKFQFLELVRLRFSLVVVFSSFFLLVMSSFLSNLSVGEKDRLLFDFGIFFIHSSMVLITTVLGAWSVSHEIGSSNLWMTLAGPVSRLEFYLGKFLGVWIFMIAYSILGTALLHLLLDSSSQVLYFYQILFCMWLEASIILSLAMFFSQWMHAFTAALSAFSFFLMGSWTQELYFLGLKMKSELYIHLSYVLKWLVPNFYQLNLRSLYFFENGISNEALAWSLVHALGWSCLALLLGGRCFQRRDLV